jgi:hypothetical protein
MVCNIFDVTYQRFSTIKAVAAEELARVTTNYNVIQDYAWSLESTMKEHCNYVNQLEEEMQKLKLVSVILKPTKRVHCCTEFNLIRATQRKIFHPRKQTSRKTGYITKIK